MRSIITALLCCLACLISAVGCGGDDSVAPTQYSLQELQDAIRQQDRAGLKDSAVELRQLFIQRFPEARRECAWHQLEIGHYYERDKGLLERAIKEYTRVYTDYPEQDLAAAEGLFSRAFCEALRQRFENAKTSLQTIFDRYSHTEGVNVDEARKLYGDVLVYQERREEATLPNPRPRGRCAHPFSMRGR